MPTTAGAVAREHVEHYLADLSDRVSAATVAKHYRSLQQPFRWLVEDGEVSVSPMARMHPPHVPEQPVPVMPLVTVRCMAQTGHNRRCRRALASVEQGTPPTLRGFAALELADSAGVTVPDGYAGWSGHSLRRGMVTEARRAGADTLRIARQGGWADNSAALAAYLVDVDRWTDHPLHGVL